MPKRPDFIPVLTASGWTINIPHTLSPTGKRQRKSFPEEKHAEAFAKKLRGKSMRGEHAVALDHDTSKDAEAAAKILQGTGITLTDAAKTALAAHQAAGKSEPFKDRYARALIDAEGRWSAVYMRDMEKLPDWVSEAFMDRQCSLINKDSIADELRTHGSKTQSTVDHRTRYIAAILNYKPRHRKAKEIEILTEAQVDAMLAACQTPAETRCVALLLFAGIRPSVEESEITRLDWSAVGKTEIYVSKDVSKTSDHHIPITPRLRKLIAGHPKEGTVLPANWRRVYRRVRSAANTKVSDITRHTFASHFLAAFGEEKTKAAMGHSANSQTLFRHYRRAVTEADGKKYFA